MDLGEGHGRDILVAVAVVGGILLALYLYTGTWPPPVVVESNSMMHVDKAEYEQNFGDTRADGVSYGRWGTIDPGDLVLVKDVDDPSEISTFADGGDEHYGMPGEVVVYFQNDDKLGTPIIHRAMTYVTVEGTGDSRTYEVRWSDAWEYTGDRGCSTEDGTRVCRFGTEGVTIRELSMRNEDFTRSGFITKGDNIAGNPAPDQVLGIFDQPVKLDQIQGIARGELPWFGLIKLTLTGNPRSTAEVQDHPYYTTIGAMTAPQDLWIMLVVGLGFVAFAPVGLDYGIHYARRWIEAKRDGEPSSNPGPPSSDDPPPPGGATPGEAGEPEEATPPDATTPEQPAGDDRTDEGDDPSRAKDEDRVELSLE